MNFGSTALPEHSPRIVGYINAGGRGTRLNGLFDPDPSTGIAKALLEIGKPLIKLVDHHIANLYQQGVENIVVAAGDQREVFEYIQDVYHDVSSIQATKSVGQLGNGGDLISYARTPSADNATILVQNVDTILDIDIVRFIHEFTYHRSLGGIASIALTLNEGVPNEGAFHVGAQGNVIRSAEFVAEGPLVDHTSDVIKYKASSTGAVIIEADFLRNYQWSEVDGQNSLYRDCLRSVWDQNGLYAYNNHHGFFRDVGTTATWLASQDDVELQGQLRYTDIHTVNSL